MTDKRLAISRRLTEHIIQIMQNILALLIVAAAVGYLIRRGWRYFAARKSAAACASGCGSCSANEGNVVTNRLGTTKPLVTIDGLRSQRPQ
ncbi:MAG TPA: FeoB-associated Cys-rich membrane protein [Pirellulales bacterium]|nr:FeoB-associated Cys-rich membrane protein [Pirellulales bacterium]